MAGGYFGRLTLSLMMLAVASGLAMGSRWGRQGPRGLEVAPVAGAADGGFLRPYNLTLYHVNQQNYTGIADMDTGDAAGDAFFDLRSYLEWWSCSNKTAQHYPGECDNPEVFADDLTVTEVTVEVHARLRDYARCNVCVNSTVPMTGGRYTCTDGEYVCVCGNYEKPEYPCKESGVGVENVKATFDRVFSETPDSLIFFNLVQRIGGNWYSTLSSGDCDNPNAKACAWRLVESHKRVSHSCQQAHIRHTVEAMAKPCFDTCPMPLNTTSTCWTMCFYQALLGPGAANTTNATGGLSADELVSLWTGGLTACPPV